jgi:hypothetical protein
LIQAVFFTIRSITCQALSALKRGIGSIFARMGYRVQGSGYRVRIGSFLEPGSLDPGSLVRGNRLVGI